MADEAAFLTKPMAGERTRKAERIPPEAFFICSAIFHYLGPAFAVLLFARVDVLGVAWLRIASAAVVFAVWKRPWRLFAELDAGERRTVDRIRFRAGNHERLLLSRDRPAAISDGRNN
jgi:inner membrane transporter RhtA